MALSQRALSGRHVPAGRELLRAQTREWAGRLRVRPAQIRVQAMRRKWGSCSPAGRVTLAAELAGEDTAFRDFVIVHELLHLRVRNHGRLFRSYLSAHVPGWERHAGRLAK